MANWCGKRMTCRLVAFTKQLHLRQLTGTFAHTYPGPAASQACPNVQFVLMSTPQQGGMICSHTPLRKASSILSPCLPRRSIYRENSSSHPHSNAAFMAFTSLFDFLTDGRGHDPATDPPHPRRAQDPLVLQRWASHMLVPTPMPGLPGRTFRERGQMRIAATLT